MGKAVAVTRREFTPVQLRAAACASEEPAQVRRLPAIALVLEGVPRQSSCVSLLSSTSRITVVVLCAFT